MFNTYKIPNIEPSKLGGVEKLEGETIEQKIERVVHNNEPITDGAPEIFTERKEGVVAAYNIRTDRWEIAADAMHLVHTSRKKDFQESPMRDNKPSEGGGSESTGTEGSGESGA